MPPTATWPRRGSREPCRPPPMAPPGGPVLLKKSRAIAHTRPFPLSFFVVFVLYVLGIAPTLCFALLEAREGAARQPTTSERHVCRPRVLPVRQGAATKKAHGNFCAMGFLPLNCCYYCTVRMAFTSASSLSIRR